MHFNEILIDLIMLHFYLCYTETFIFYLLENCLILMIVLHQPRSESKGLIQWLKDTVR